MHPSTEEPSLLNTTTLTGLATLLTITTSAYLLSLRLLPSTTTRKLRAFYIWHLADSLVHFILEGSYLYNCFFTFTSRPPLTSDYPHPASLSSASVIHFLNRPDRIYGSNQGTNIFAKLWQDYAKADRRWGGADVTIISLEILTVVLGGPLALYVAELIRRGGGGGRAGRDSGRDSAKLWFWGSLLACGALYGGFMVCIQA